MERSRFDLDDGQKEELIAWWLKDMEDPETPFFIDGGVALSAIDITNAIRENTVFGREQLAILFLQREEIPLTLDVKKEVEQFVEGSLTS